MLIPKEAIGDALEAGSMDGVFQLILPIGGSSQFRGAISTTAKGASKAYLAAPFFSDSTLIAEMTNGGCSVDLLVRRCLATSPAALRDVLAMRGVAVRFTDKTAFHSKLFIFNTGVAIVGSANLTTSGLSRNHEAGVLIQDDTKIPELMQCFSALWNGRDVHDLDEDAVRELEQLVAETREFAEFVAELERTKLDRKPKPPPVEPEPVQLQSAEAGEHELVGPAYMRDPLYADKTKNQKIPLNIFASNALPWLLRHFEDGRISRTEGKHLVEQLYGRPDLTNDVGGAAAYLSMHGFIRSRDEEPSDYVLTDRGWKVLPRRTK